MVHGAWYLVHAQSSYAASAWLQMCCSGTFQSFEEAVVLSLVWTDRNSARHFRDVTLFENPERSHVWCLMSGRTRSGLTSKGNLRVGRGVFPGLF